MHMHDRAAIVMVEQVLAPGRGAAERQSVEEGGIGEPALRT